MAPAAAAPPSPEAPATLPLSAAAGDVQLSGGGWMSSSASLDADGLLLGKSHSWSTAIGFTGNVVGMVVGARDQVVWPPTPEDDRHRFGVADATEGVRGGGNDRTDNWENGVPIAVTQGGTVARLVLHEFVDHRHIALSDVTITDRTVAEAMAMITNRLAG